MQWRLLRLLWWVRRQCHNGLRCQLRLLWCRLCNVGVLRLLQNVNRLWHVGLRLRRQWVCQQGHAGLCYYLPLLRWL